MGVDDNKEIIRREYKEIWNKRDLSVVPELKSPNYVYLYSFGVYEVIDGFKKFVAAWRTALPDIKITIDETVRDDETLAIRTSWSNTFLNKMSPLSLMVRW